MGPLPARLNFELYPSSRYPPSVHQKFWFLCPFPDQRLHISNMQSLIASRQILVVPIFSNTIMTNLKKFIENKSIKTKQCPTGLSPRIFPLNLYRKPWVWGRISANSQKSTHFSDQKNPPK